MYHHLHTNLHCTSSLKCTNNETNASKHTIAIRRFRYHIHTPPSARLTFSFAVLSSEWSNTRAVVTVFLCIFTLALVFTGRAATSISNLQSSKYELFERHTINWFKKTGFLAHLQSSCCSMSSLIFLVAHA